MKRTFPSLGVLLLLWLNVSPPSFANPQKTKPRTVSKAPSIQLFALQYGRSWFRTRNILARKTKRKYVKFAWLFYLVVAPKRKILLDSGFVQRRYIQNFAIKDYTHPQTLLARLGIQPSEITDVIATHSHFDHAGGLHLFPNARLILHRKSYLALASSRSLPQVRKTVRRKFKAGKVLINRKSLPLTSYLRVEHVGGHTRGSQVVYLRMGATTFVLVGDECYLVKACRKGWRLPGRSASNIRKNRTFVRRLSREIQRKNVIPLTGHDPVIMKRYKKVKEGIVRVAP